MQVPEHVVSLYIATCGQNGPGLGSDEKEIILLVYVLLESATGQIIGTKQILVRPDGHLVKDRTVSTSSDASNATSTAAASPPLLNYNDSATNNNNNNNNNANITNNNISNVVANITNINNNNNSSNNNNNIIATTYSNGLNNNNNNNSITNLENNNIMDSLPIAEALAAGKPLNEAIEEFDAYLRSLSLIDNMENIKLITDGQLPIRQCLHREACAKDIELPIYYNTFCDLRKEILRYKSGDLSRALVPVKDIKKMLQIPALPQPQSIGEMLKELNIPSVEDNDFYVRESRDMVTVIQTLLKSGHNFAANEFVNLILEPGICSIDDEIDGNCIVRARGLPWQSSDQDIAKFFRGLNVAKGGVALCLSPLGRRNGEALIRFISQEHRDMALKRHKHHIGSRYIEVYRATGEDFLAIAGGASNEAQAFLSKGAQVIIRMRGLPYDCTAKQVLDFFTTGENPCTVLDGTEGVLFVKKPDGRATGDAFVLFASEADAPKALGRHRESIGQRYIELFRSTTAEVQQVLNRSLDPKTYESNNHSQPPLIAQLPTMQLSLLPQHLITSGTTKNCIRLRGLPYEAMVEHILHFLDDFAKHIIYQGVHMVINAQGQPSGEAFIQMDSEDSARLCAQRKHNQFMVFGKKYRYIEVFQCSGDDMNMVLNGGIQAPAALTPHTPHPSHAAHHPHGVAAAAAAAAAVAAAAGKQPSLLSPGASMISAPFAPFSPFGPPTPILASPHRAPHHHPHHGAPHPGHPAAFYTHPLVYWPYPSPPVSPTTYYSQPGHSPPHVPSNLAAAAAAQHQAIYPVEFLPTTFTPQGTPISPTSVAIPHTSAGLIISPNTKTTFVPTPKQHQQQQQHHHHSHQHQQVQQRYSPLSAATTIIPTTNTSALAIAPATAVVVMTTPPPPLPPSATGNAATSLTPPQTEATTTDRNKTTQTESVSTQTQTQAQSLQPQTLLTIDTTQAERALKKLTKVATGSPSSSTTNASGGTGQTIVTTTTCACVELYIS